MKKKIEIEIPDGKQAKWVNNVLTLVNDTPKDVRDRVKTFEDACAELGDTHPFVQQYYYTAASYKGDPMTEDFIAYLKLRIITAALNEGWEPQFVSGESRWYPWFYAKQGVLECTQACSSGSPSYPGNGMRLAFKSRELAEYAGTQFVNIYKDFLWRE